MNHERRLLDPTAEQETAERPRLARPTSLDGLTVAVLDISKARGDIFLDRLAERLDERGVTVKRYRKPTVVKPAPMDIQQAIAAECDIVVEGLAD
jgi:hypothetical protein